jgi:hypothetical protein
VSSALDLFLKCREIYDLRNLYVTPRLIRQVSHQDYFEGFLMNQEYTSAHTYKLDLNILIDN